ncbi:MAG: malate/lactate/ureidoglycolate dehydrogenase [Reyranellaceae bacterium]
MHYIPPVRLTRMAAAILAASGSNDRETRIVADHLVEANLKGHDSHGVGMIPRYIDDRLAGLLKTNGSLRIVSDNGPMVVADGDNASGQVMAHDATSLGIERARRDGLTLVALRNCHHMGRIGTYAEMTAAAGLSSIHFVNVTGHDPLVAPWGGADARFATNPIAISIPAGGGKPAVILDFATSKVALGKVRVAMNKGERMEPGLLIDSAGAPTTDPTTMFGDALGAILPMGDHKGSGLALIAELFAGAFCGGGTIHDGNARDRSVVNNMLSIVFDPDRLAGRSYVEREVATMIDYVKAAPRAPGVEEVLVAGEPELRTKAARTAKGVPVDPTTFEQLLLAGEKVGLRREEMLRLVG